MHLVTTIGAIIESGANTGGRIVNRLVIRRSENKWKHPKRKHCVTPQGE